MIVDELSIVKMEILSNIGKQLAKAYSFFNFSTTVLGGLPIVIVMGNFYQFLPIAVRLLWGETQTDKDHNGKIL